MTLLLNREDEPAPARSRRGRGRGRARGGVRAASSRKAR